MKKLFLTLGIALILVTPTLALGASVLENALYADPASETGKLLKNFEPRGVAKIKTPGVIVFEVLQIVLGFLGIVGVIMMIYAGFLWITAGGEEEKATQGRTILFQAIVGILIVLAAYTITYFIINQLTTAVTSG